MNLIKFPVAATNIFPCSNSTAGGQYLSEFNLRSRESVGTDPSVKYPIGPSFVHCEDDFYVSRPTDTVQAAGATSGQQVYTSSTLLEIAPGRGVINGHYIELLTPIQVDMAEVNEAARIRSLPALKGELCIGLRIMYSTLPTMAGSMRTENAENYYEGIQIVILPKDEFKLPKDVPQDNQEAEVTAHILLAKFTYLNGEISGNITNNSEKCQYIDASRIGNFGNMLKAGYVSKNNLNPARLYTYAGKGVHTPAASEPWTEGWCDSTGSLMVWNSAPEDFKEDTPSITRNDGSAFNRATISETAHFEASGNKVQLVVPHKQIDGYAVMSTNGKPVKYKDRVLQLPVASYSAGTPGVVDNQYTEHIKRLATKVENYYTLPNGTQRGYLDELNYKDSDATVKVRDLPPINSSWNIGDYILVNVDNTVDNSTDGARAPVTMYAVLPGKVQSLDSTSVNARPTGTQLDWAESEVDPASTDFNIADYFDVQNSIYRGIVGVDYFTYSQVVDGDVKKTVFFKVATASSKEYSDPLLITGQMPLAQENVIGGFYDVPSNAIDMGYVYLDEDGRLRLMDYALLRSGTLAYQLGQDFTSSTNLTTEAIQDELNEWVNQRIAFPNVKHLQSAENPNVIKIEITLPKSESEVSIDIFDIDSRFNTAIELHILGEADSKTTINISDCARIRIAAIAGTPEVNLYRSCIYYDADILNRLNIINDMQLWYSRFVQEGDSGYSNMSPRLLVNGLSVEQYESEVIPEHVDFWDMDSAPGDNHYAFALKGITFDPNGNIVGCKLLVKNTSSEIPTIGESIVVANFVLPQGLALTYPKNRLTKQLKVTGDFISAYQTTDGEDPQNGVMVQKTHFTAITQINSEYAAENYIPGTVTIYSEAKHITNVHGLTFNQESATMIDGVSAGDLHMFEGGVIS